MGFSRAMTARAAARWVQARERIQLPEGGMRLAAVADTHSHPHPRTVELLAELSPHHVVHAGDIGDLEVLETLRAVAPLSAVRGNIDGRSQGLPDGITLEVCAGEQVLLTILLLHIALAGPRLRADALRLAAKERASLVICGHSHVPFLGRQGALTVLNPGSVGPRRFQLPILFGVVDIGRERVTMRHVSCETGQTWTP